MINWVKLGKYAVVASGFGVAIAVPAYGYWTLLKKSEELNNSLEKTNEDLEQLNKVLDEAKKIESENNEAHSALQTETSGVKSEKDTLVQKSTSVITGVKGVFEKIRKNWEEWFGNGRRMTTWDSKMEANEKLVQELEKLVKDNKQ